MRVLGVGCRRGEKPAALIDSAESHPSFAGRSEQPQIVIKHLFGSWWNCDKMGQVPGARLSGRLSPKPEVCTATTSSY